MFKKNKSSRSYVLPDGCKNIGEIPLKKPNLLTVRVNGRIKSSRVDLRDRDGKLLGICSFTTVRVLRGVIARMCCIYRPLEWARGCERLEVFPGFSPSRCRAKLFGCMLENLFSPNSPTSSTRNNFAAVCDATTGIIR